VLVIIDKFTLKAHDKCRDVFLYDIKCSTDSRCFKTVTVSNTRAETVLFLSHNCIAAP